MFDQHLSILTHFRGEWQVRLKALSSEHWKNVSAMRGRVLLINFFFFFVVSLLLERFFFPIIVIVMFGSLCSPQQSILPLLVAHLKSGISVNMKLILLKAWIE